MAINKYLTKIASSLAGDFGHYVAGRVANNVAEHIAGKAYELGEKGVIKAGVPEYLERKKLDGLFEPSAKLLGQAATSIGVGFAMDRALSKAYQHFNPPKVVAKSLYQRAVENPAIVAGALGSGIGAGYLAGKTGKNTNRD